MDNNPNDKKPFQTVVAIYAPDVLGRKRHVKCATGSPCQARHRDAVVRRGGSIWHESEIARICAHDLNSGIEVVRIAVIVGDDRRHSYASAALVLWSEGQAARRYAHRSNRRNNAGTRSEVAAIVRSAAGGPEDQRCFVRFRRAGLVGT